jgi:hypothetical protein
VETADPAAIVAGTAVAIVIAARAVTAADAAATVIIADPAETATIVDLAVIAETGAPAARARSVKAATATAQRPSSRLRS